MPTDELRWELTESPQAADLDAVDAGHYLDTFSFQAPEFYRRCGYATALRIDGFADGIAKHLMVKRLGDGAD